MTSRFLEALASGAVLGDGAMGTELLARRAAWELSSSEVNLTDPDLVHAVHREYAEAGCELLRTNTFTANSIRMPGDRAREAILRGVALARRAAGPGRFVAGSVGPLSDVKADPERRATAYGDQCRNLLDGGCDAIVLETFRDLGDLGIAVRAARATGLPVVAQVALQAAADGLRDLPADVVGVNCLGPEEVGAALEKLASRTRSCFPSAGLPTKVGYPVSPASFAQAAERLRAAGVRLIGGCCGTGPGHLRAAARGLGR
jgi:homocysteine S-methyltransferase